MPDFKGRVLIFDDDPAVGRTIAAMASSLGFGAKHACDPDSFFCEVQKWDPSHIVLDLVMPRMDGIEVLQRLASRARAAQIAISSGLDARVLAAAVQSAREHGLCTAQVLEKPVGLPELRDFLEAGQGPEIPSRLHSVPEGGDVAIPASELREALARNQLTLSFQPKITCSTRRVVGFEALVRWNHPHRGVIYPDNFVPLAESEGLIGPMTDEVIRLALDWYASTIDDPGVLLSLNVSALSLSDDHIVSSLSRSCEQRGVSPTSVILEVTETAAVKDQVASLDLLTRLRIKGFRISIDDFGVGTSTLKALSKWPFSEVKIDKCFGMTASTSAESRVIIRSTVDLGHQLGLKVVAEGVEDIDALDFLAQSNCDYAQGYFIAKPIAAECVQGWLRDFAGRQVNN